MILAFSFLFLSFYFQYTPYNIKANQLLHAMQKILAAPEDAANLDNFSMEICQQSSVTEFT